ncbi:hypothetical protein OLX02_16745 [Novosphingobium sp. KCTC 2891]|uniref:hypothetical protein n=1 Tax=Novosphingobium sp. KCTC 2891 TaxID=2989730 RepID=UPI002223C0BD|nr:hypothetical protein [Novosphingobium sp. KCTC 2891]MCW1384472.1 hypothetical protein [Novosphingobium sp. KCTC 2891]
MSNLATFLTAIALAMPGAVPPAASPLLPGAAQDELWQAAVEPEGVPLLPKMMGEGALADMSDPLSDDTWNQVRIEQRLVIRILPPRPAGRDTLQIPPQPNTIRFRERKMANCLPVLGIAGVQPTTDSRLLLFMRDRRIVGASLDKQCSPRDFYMGFYVQQTQDGMLCVGRDSIHSRSGSTCTVSRMRELIPGE